MAEFKDLTGQKYGLLTVIERAYVGKPRGWWRCRCECGKETIASSDTLKRGGKRSCGCLAVKNHPIKHGCGKRRGRTRLYHTWSGMIQRTTNPKDKYYMNYGGRGIKVCDEWRNFSVFKEWAESNGYRDDLFIDRIDNDRGYSPDNCRFSTRLQQQNNLRCNIRFCFSDNQILTETEVANMLGIKKSKVKSVLRPYIILMEDINPSSGVAHMNYLNKTLFEVEDAP